jgi:hypothetical protein
MNGHCTVIAAFPVAKAAINRLRSPRIFNDIGWLTEVMDGSTTPSSIPARATAATPTAI